MLKPIRKMFLIVLISAIITGIASGYLSAYFILKSKTPKFMTVDVKGIVDQKRYELSKRLMDKQEDAEKLEREFAVFLKRLDNILESYFADKSAIYIRKEALIDGNYRDITEEVKRKLNEN